MEYTIYMLPIGFIASVVLGYFAVKNRWKIVDFF